MADYWKSQPKKFCQYCKCWIADNKPSVEFHEKGKHHKENVAAKITEIKQKSLEKAKQEKRMSKEFAAMEEAALKAYEEDIKRMQMESGSVTQVQTPVPPQPPIKQKEKPKKQASRNNNPKNKSRVSKDWKDWVEGKSDDGHVYYYNRTTGESQWEKPEGFQGGSSAASQLGHNQGGGSAGSAWMEAVSPDGYTYYYNTETGASSWEIPACLGSSAEGESPQPEPPGVGESSGGMQPSKEADGSGQGGEQSNVAKISFREGDDNAEGDSQSEGAVEGGGETQNTTAVAEEEERKKKEEEEKKRKEEEEEEKRRKDEEEVKKRQIQAKKRKLANPYGVWERIQEEDDPFASVDLQLPQTGGDADPAPDVLQPPPEAKPKFKERTITSLGADGGPASFRKSRAQNGKARSLRQRGKDD